MTSERCNVVLRTPPECTDFRKVRSYVMCKAHKDMEEKRITFREAIKQGWQEVRKVCAT
jgi:hypothetical protein